MDQGPQLENGYTSIANEILDAFMKTQFSGYERRVLDYIIRKTYGWKKKMDRISLSQIAEATGILKPHVSRALAQLMLRKVVTKRGNEIGINKYHSQWRELPKGVTNHTVTKIGNTITPFGNKSLPKLVTTKEKKETSQKKQRPNGLLSVASQHDDREKKPKGENPSLPIDGVGVGGGGKAEGVEHLFERAREILRVTVRDRTIYKANLKARVRTYGEETLLAAWVLMATDPWLNGENPDGKRYLTMEYAVRRSSVEKWVAKLDEGKIAHASTQVLDLPPAIVTSPDGTRMKMFPDGRMVPA